MNYYKLLLTSCAVLLFSGCEDIKKQGGEKPKVEQAVASKEEKKTDKVSAMEKKVEEIAQPKEESKGDNVAKLSKDLNLETDKVAAVFADGSSLSQADVLKRIKLLPDNMQSIPFSQLYNTVLFVMLQEELSYRSANKEGFVATEVIKAGIEELRYNIGKNNFLKTEVEKKLTEEEVKKFYDELIKNFVPLDEVGLRHILVKDEKEALEIVRQLQEGESFDKIQIEKTLDKKTLESKGFLGYFKEAQLPEGQAKEIMQTPSGNFVSVPIFVPKTGYSVLFITEKRKSSPAPFEKMRDRVRRLVLKKKILERVEEIFSEEGIVFYDVDGKVSPRKSIDEKLAEFRQKKVDGKKSAEKEKIIDNLKEDFVVAKFGNGKTIVLGQVLEFVKTNPSMFRGLSVYDVFVAATEEYVSKLVLSARIEKERVMERVEVKKQIEEGKRSFVAQKYLDKLAQSYITEDLLRKEFDLKMAKFDANEQEIRMSVIPVKSKEDALKAMTAIKSGKSFSVVMKEFCSDERFLEKNGDMGYLKKNQIILLSSELYEVASKAPKATFLPQPIEVNGQLLVVKVEDKRRVEKPKFQDEKNKLMLEVFPKVLIKITTDLCLKENVKAYNFKGESIKLSEKEIEKSLGGTSSIS